MKRFLTFFVVLMAMLLTTTDLMAYGLPRLTDDPSSPVLYRIRNTRRVTKGTASYWTVANGLSTSASDAPQVYFVGSTTAGVAKVKIVNNATGLQLKRDMTWADEGFEWSIQERAAGDGGTDAAGAVYRGVTISTAPEDSESRTGIEMDGSNSGCWYVGSSDTKIMCHRPTADGSIFTLEPLEVLPQMTTDEANPIFYRIYNMYTGKYLVAKSNKHELTTDAAQASKYYFTADDRSNSGNGTYVHIWSPDVPGKIVKSATGWEDNTSSARHWYLKEKTNSCYTGVIMSYDGISDCWKVSSTGTQVEYAGTTDKQGYKGSIFNFELIPSNFHELGDAVLSVQPGIIVPNDVADGTLTLSYPSCTSGDDEVLSLKPDHGITVDGNPATVSFNDGVLTISGLPTTLGTSFTITIPAGAIGYQTSGVTNEAMELNYTISKPLIDEAIDGYLYTIIDGEPKFMSRGENYQTRLIIDDYGIPVRIDPTTGDGGTTITCLDSQLPIYSAAAREVYTDGAVGNSNTNLKVTSTGNDGEYYIQCNNDVKRDGYFGPRDASRWHIISEEYDQSGAYKWKMMSKADHDALIAARVAGYKSAALAAAGMTEADLENAVLREELGAADTQTAYKGGNILENWVASNSSSASFTKEWTFNELDEGLYHVTINAFNRNGTPGNVNEQYAAGYDDHLTFLIVNGQKQRIQSCLSGMTTTALSGDKSEITVDGTPYYYPVGKTSASDWMDAGHYQNDMYVYVADGTLNVSLVRNAFISQTWTIYRDLVITRVLPEGTEEDVVRTELLNADFGNGTARWTVETRLGGEASGSLGTYAPNNDVTQTPHCVEAYSGWGSQEFDDFRLSQKVQLPAGKYRLRGYAFVKDPGVSTAELFAGANSVSVCSRDAYANVADRVPYQVPNYMHEASEAFSAGNYLNELIFQLDAEQVVEIGFRGHHNAYRAWFINGPVTLEKITDEQLAEEAAAEVTDLKALYASRKATYSAVAAQHTKSGVDFNTSAADALLEAATTKAAVETAINALGKALTDYMDAFTSIQPFDLTALIVNPSFETESPIGWYHVTEGGDVATKLNSNGTYTVNGFVGERLFNTWYGNDGDSYDHYVLQRIDYLPAGYYTLAAKVATNQGSSAHLRLLANDAESDDLATTDKGQALQGTLKFLHDEAGRVRIGLKAERWFKCDDFKLTYVPYDEPDDWMAIDLGTINLENDHLKDYLDRADYTSESATTILTGGSNNDFPRPVVVPLPKEATGSVKVYVTAVEDDYTNAMAFEPTNSREAELVNLIPMTTYYYKVENDGTIVSKGTFETTGRVRVMKIDGVCNVRDLGGRYNSAGQWITPGLIYRGGEFNKGYQITAKGKQTLAALGLGAELDLRQYSGDNNGFHDESALVDVIPDIRYYASDQIAHGESSLRNQEMSKWAADLNFVMDNVLADRPVYFHCRIGADRTGMMGFLLDGVLGQNRDIICKNFEITSFSSANASENLYRHFDSTSDYGLINKFKPINERNGETLQERFEDFFVNVLGISAFKLAQFQAKMLGLEAPTFSATWTEPLHVTTLTGSNALSNSANLTGFMGEDWKLTEIGAHTHGVYQVNTWSTEQNSDGSGIAHPFCEFWTGNADVLGNATLTRTLHGLEPGYYDISTYVRIYDLNGDYNATRGVSGLTMKANEATLPITNGRTISQGDLTGKGFAGRYHIVGHVAEDGLLTIGFETSSADFNWLAFTDVQIEYIGSNDSYTATADGITTLCGNAAFDAATSVDASTLALDITRLAQNNAMQIDVTESPNVLITANVGQVGNAQNVIVDGTCQNLLLTDKKSFKPASDFTALTASYTRNATTSRYGTICLPYAVEASADVKLYTFEAQKGDYLTFTEVPEVSAGMPALYEKVGTTEPTAQASNVLIKAELDTESGDFVGTFQSMDITSGYYIAKDSFYDAANYNGGSVSVPAFRGYFPNLVVGAKALRIAIGDEETGLRDITTELPSEAIYNLQGIRLRTPQRGINIVGGRKVVLK